MTVGYGWFVVCVLICREILGGMGRHTENRDGLYWGLVFIVGWGDIPKIGMVCTGDWYS